MKFSILTATHNCSKYISDCIRSVIAQDYPDWELIISDDCSSDDTYSIASSFESEKITVIRNRRKLFCGPNYAKLLSNATGDCCGILDGDDILLPNAVSTIISYYESNPEIDFIWTRHKWCNKDLSKSREGLSCKPHKKTIYESEKGLKHIYSHWRTFRTEMRNRGILFRDLKCTVDKDLGYNLEEMGSGGFLPIVLYCYRYHKGNMSHNSSQKKEWIKIRQFHDGRARNKVVTL